jgi:flap endonuclease-1
MGIKNLIKLISMTNAIEYIPIIALRDKTIAIEGGTFLYRNWAVAYRVVAERTNILQGNPDRREAIIICRNLINGFLNQLKTYNIKPVLVLDGQAPEDKKETQNKRRCLKRDSLDELEELRRQEVDDESKLRKLALRSLSLETSDVDALIADLDIDILYAKGEAEQLCSSLAVEGKAYAVYSTDTDNLVYGCPLLLTNYNNSLFRAIFLDKVLAGLDLTFEQFVDVCIMTGCDYNDNIRRIGPKNSYRLIKNYGSIEEAAKAEGLDTSCLNYIRCRELFRYRPSDELIRDVRRHTS